MTLLDLQSRLREIIADASSPDAPDSPLIPAEKIFIEDKADIPATIEAEISRGTALCAAIATERVSRDSAADGLYMATASFRISLFRSAIAPSALTLLTLVELLARAITDAPIHATGSPYTFSLAGVEAGSTPKGLDSHTLRAETSWCYETPKA
ncbi:MAG: hypothetical protein LBG65_07625 [Puniceicoccales bacterium]|nr:hypothetical protein [Puniceicoccales bacterium]